MEIVGTQHPKLYRGGPCDGASSSPSACPWFGGIFPSRFGPYISCSVELTYPLLGSVLMAGGSFSMTGRCRRKRALQQFPLETLGAKQITRGNQTMAHSRDQEL